MSFSFKSHARTGQEIDGLNDIDVNGNPAGGLARGIGIDIHWQNGTVNREASEIPNGAFVEDVLDVCASRLQFYQDSPFACDENALARDYVNRAIEVLNLRRDDREARKVQGKHEA